MEVGSPAARRWWVRRGRVPTCEFFVHIEHAHAFVDGSSEHQTGRAVARQAVRYSKHRQQYLDAYDAGAGACRSGPKRDNINILSIGDSVLIGQALEAGRVDAAVLDGALVRRLRSKGFSTIADLQPAKIPMLNQAIVVHPDFLQKRSEIAEKILMTLVESLAFSLRQGTKRLLFKTMMRRFQVNDPTVAEEGYQDYSPASSANPFELGRLAKHQKAHGCAQSEGGKRQDRRSRR